MSDDDDLNEHGSPRSRDPDRPVSPLRESYNAVIWGSGRWNRMGPEYHGRAYSLGWGTWFDKETKERQVKLVAARANRIEHPINFEICYDRGRNGLTEIPNNDVDLHIALKYNGYAARGRIFEFADGYKLCFFNKTHVFPPIDLGTDDKPSKLMQQLKTSLHIRSSLLLTNYSFIAELTTRDLTTKNSGSTTLGQVAEFQSLCGISEKEQKQFGYVVRDPIEYNPKNNITSFTQAMEAFQHNTGIHMQIKLVGAIEFGTYRNGQPELIKTFANVDTPEVKGVQWTHLTSAEQYTCFVNQYIDSERESHNEGFVMERVKDGISLGMIKLKRTTRRTWFECRNCNTHGELKGECKWRVKSDLEFTNGDNVWLLIHGNPEKFEEDNANLNHPQYDRMHRMIQNWKIKGGGYFYLIYSQLHRNAYPEFAVACYKRTKSGDIYDQVHPEQHEPQHGLQHESPAKRAKTDEKEAHHLAAAMRNVYLVNLVDLGGLVCPGRI